MSSVTKSFSKNIDQLEDVLYALNKNKISLFFHLVVFHKQLGDVLAGGLACFSLLLTYLRMKGQVNFGRIGFASLPFCAGLLP